MKTMDRRSFMGTIGKPMAAAAAVAGRFVDIRKWG